MRGVMGDKSIKIGSTVRVGKNAYDGPEIADETKFEGVTGTVVKDLRVSTDFVVVVLDGPDNFYRGKRFTFDMAEVSLVM